MKNVISNYKRIYNKKKAFTLIELLIVIAIIGILFIVLVSKVDFATDKAKATGVQTDFRSFQMAFDQVSRENSGFAMFGWDTGDNGRNVSAGATVSINGNSYVYTNANIDKGDRIRNSYDVGDANLNGKQDVNGKDGYTGTTEVFTGRKIYTENWTGIYSLINPGDANDFSAVFALESAINANLDPKLHITINNDYTITMANQARDPWGNEYHGYYLSNATVDGGDRGAIVMYSNGANGKFGLIQSIANGEVTISIPGNNIQGQDDYSMVSCYTFANGYGEAVTTTTGFSNNQSFKANNNKPLISTQNITLSGTKWNFDTELEYDESVFGNFDYENQTGWDDFGEGCYMTNGSITLEVWGFTIEDAFGIKVFGPVFPSDAPYNFVYLGENEWYESGWWVVPTEMSIKFLTGQISDPEEFRPYIYKTIAPTIVFSDSTSAALENTTLMNWLQDNANEK